MASASAETDFDFFEGEWRVTHRRLKTRLAGCIEWEEFGGRCTVWKTLGGFGNVDDNVIEFPAGAYRAITMRSFDPRTRLWAIWWLDGRTPHQLDVPVIGGFIDGVGAFYADDHFEGRSIRVRFRWSHIETGAPRWEQAFSADAGASWETNWIMQFARAETEA
ncbi:MAG: hypothetical protein K2P58_12190 [Hyphomonadaceae bacterium]|nr:hypothetical protein [Hyphomonadaceae bacterium]